MSTINELVERECLRSRLIEKAQAQSSTSRSAAPSSPEPVDQAVLGTSKEAGTTPAKARWTVLVYANGNDINLNRLSPSLMRQLEVAGSDERLSVAAQISRSPFVTDRFSKDWSGTRRYDVVQNPHPPSITDELKRLFIPPYTADITSPVVADLGQTDMGDAKTFQDFLHWGMQAHPAEHYAVLVYGQGGSFVGATRDGATGHTLTPEQIADSLKSAARDSGSAVDLLALDANLMGSVENAATFKDSAKVLVASEGPVKMTGYPLDAIVKDLKFDLGDGKDVQARDLARWFVFESRYQPPALAQQSATSATAIDLTQIDPLNGALDVFAGALRQAVAADSRHETTLRELMGQTQAFAPAGPKDTPYGDQRDLADLCTKVLSTPDLATQTGVAAGAQGVLDALKQATIDEFHIPKLGEAQGLSAYMPTNYGYDQPSTVLYPKGYDPHHGYETTALAQTTRWNELLSDIAEDTALRTQLRTMGLSEQAIHGLDVVGTSAKTLAEVTLKLGKRAGHLEAAQAARGKEPIKFMGLSAQIAVRLGGLGGVYQGFEGARQMFDAATDSSEGNRLVKGLDGAADFTTGAAVTACMIGLSVAQAASVATPAGIVSYAVPIAKTVFDLLMARHRIAEQRGQTDGLSPAEKLSTLSNQPQGPDYASPAVDALVDLLSPDTINPDSLPSPRVAGTAVAA